MHQVGSFFLRYEEFRPWSCNLFRIGRWVRIISYLSTNAFRRIISTKGSGRLIAILLRISRTFVNVRRLFRIGILFRSGYGKVFNMMFFMRASSFFRDRFNLCCSNDRSATQRIAPMKSGVCFYVRAILRLTR